MTFGCDFCNDSTCTDVHHVLHSCIGGTGRAVKDRAPLCRVLLQQTPLGYLRIPHSSSQALPERRLGQSRGRMAYPARPLQYTRRLYKQERRRRTSRLRLRPAGRWMELHGSRAAPQCREGPPSRPAAARMAACMAAAGSSACTLTPMHPPPGNPARPAWRQPRPRSRSGTHCREASTLPSGWASLRIFLFTSGLYHVYDIISNKRQGRRSWRSWCVGQLQSADAILRCV
jgi:hypothetical protein